jgi:hypothetical protein
MRTLITPLLFITVLISACASHPVTDRPDWIDVGSKRYPAELYLSGQGSADTLDDAKDRARADLAKQFEVAIDEHGRQEQQYRKKQKGEESRESLQQSVSRQLITRTTRTVQGIEIADNWQDEATHKYYTLAVLSKQKARQQFTQQIDGLDQQTLQRLKQAEDEKDALRKTALIQQAIDIQQQRTAVQSALQVVDASGRGIPAKYSLGELLRTRDTLIGRIALAPATEGIMAQRLQPLLSGNTATAGFKVAEAGQSDYDLVAEAKLEPPLKEKGWIWLRGTLQLTLRDSSGNEIGVKRWPLKAASITQEQTEQRLLDDVDSILKNELRGAVLGFAKVE